MRSRIWSVGEVVVARDLDLDHFVPFAGSDDVGDLPLVVADVLGREVDLDVEVALILEVVAQVADAAHQQVAIDGLLVEDRNVLFQIALGNLGAVGLDFDFRAAIGLDGGADAILLGQVVLVVEGDRGGEPVLLVVFLRMLRTPRWVFS